MRGPIDQSARPGLPIHITEWSSSYSSRDPVHDSYFTAPYILEQLKHTENGIASMSYWVFTDIFEENGPAMTPFHGGFGLLNEQGIKKPAFFAYQFLNQLGGTELKNTDANSWVCRDDHGGAQVLLWDLTDMSNQGQTANPNAFRKLRPPGSKGTTHVSLANVPAGQYELTLHEVGYQKNDAYSAWIAMGFPPQLTRDQEQKLRDASTGAPEFTRTVTVAADGHFEQTLPLRENDVLLLSLARR
jgi:xylan 1,4-beta-xylosidase